ncbi:MAG: NADH-quinone oxidoreductase subunit A [Actinobacteria bacterium HGW-Actinobacteria-7]|jgi:NADH-quinone oxidoreductase subunit A|nr:MAG: NADH-quinone oxidoreductase subunit A [Actinobacteria bacterium HGW-Actinobacteria-7]
MSASLDLIVVAAFVVIGALFVAVALSTSWLLSPKNPTPEKAETYECGVETIGSPWIQFRVGYYVYALLYVIFDIETVFLYPWAVVFKQTGWFVFTEMIVFIAILFGGLAYAWKEGALKWR